MIGMETLVDQWQINEAIAMREAEAKEQEVINELMQNDSVAWEINEFLPAEFYKLMCQGRRLEAAELFDQAESDYIKWRMEND